MTHRLVRQCILMLLIISLILPMFNVAQAQSPYNQPQVEIKEGSAFIQYSFPGGNYNVSISGYINITNVASSDTLFDVNVTYAPFPAPFTITQLGATVYNASGSFAKPAVNMLQTGRIHVNEIPPLTTYQVQYTIAGNNLSQSVDYGFPELIFANESVYFKSQYDSGSTWHEQVIVYNSSINAYVTNQPVLYGDQVSFLLWYNNTDSADLEQLVFKKQLPTRDNASTGNATFTVNDARIWSLSGAIPVSIITPDVNNLIDFPITGGNLQPGDTLYVRINGTLSNVTGVPLPPGGGIRYINTNPAYLGFTTDKSNASFLGSYINSSTDTWITAGGDGSMILIKGFNALENKWQFNVEGYNPGDISFVITSLKVYRNNYPAAGDYEAAVASGPIYAIYPNQTFDPGQTFELGNIVDYSYSGSSTQPPVYWAVYTARLNGTVTGQYPNYKEHIVITADNPANVTVVEPYLRLSQWRLDVMKNATYNPVIGKYVINITVANIGFGPTPSGIRIYDYVPVNFNATSFIKDGSPHDPDYHGAPLVNGPTTIGWDLQILDPEEVSTVSYIVQGNASEYYSSALYVVGADPMNVEGAIPGGNGLFNTGISSTSIELMGLVLVAVLLTAGILRRRA